MTDSTAPTLAVGLQELLDAGLHFGHQTKRWNPKMKRFIFDKRNGIYIIDLAKSLAQLKEAQQFVYRTVAAGKSVLFVGTKKQSQDIIKEAATRCGQHYMITRWLGGTLTNHQNVKSSVKHMREIETMAASGELDKIAQKEASRYRHELARLQRNLSGIANMAEMPGAMVVIDVNREANAVKEANRMQIPVVAVVDTNCDPDPIEYPIPGNDDAIRAIRLIVNCLADAIVKANAEYAVVAAEQNKKREAAAAEAAKKREAEAAESRAAAEDEKAKRKKERKPRSPATPAEPKPAGTADPAKDVAAAAAG